MFTPVTSNISARLLLVGAALALIFAACGDATEPEPGAEPVAVEIAQEAPAAVPLAASAAAQPAVPSGVETAPGQEVTSEPAPAQSPLSGFENGEPPPSAEPAPAAEALPGAEPSPIRFVAGPAAGVPALPGSGGASGSGCSPGAGPLPDGVWYGVVDVRSESAIDFDLACWYFTFETDAPCAADPPAGDSTDDYCVSNENPTLRTVPVASDAVFHEDTGDPNGFLTTPFSARPPGDQAWGCPVDYCGLWLYVNHGEVTEFMEQYTP